MWWQQKWYLRLPRKLSTQISTLISSQFWWRYISKIFYNVSTPDCVTLIIMVFIARLRSCTTWWTTSTRVSATSWNWPCRAQNATASFATRWAQITWMFHHLIFLIYALNSVRPLAPRIWLVRILWQGWPLHPQLVVLVGSIVSMTFQPVM